VLARQVSADAGAAETILFRDGFLTEAAASNVFVVKGGAVAAAPQDNHILLGITYELLTDLAREGKVRFGHPPIAEAEVRAADEIWLSSSTKEVPPSHPRRKARGRGACRGRSSAACTPSSRNTSRSSRAASAVAD